MKRCPECRRDYSDDTLLYCLEDGIALVQGSVPSPDEPQTAILYETDSPSEAATREQINIRASETSQSFGHSSGKRNFLANRKAKPLLIGLIALIAVLGAFFGYRYLTSVKPINSIAVMPFTNESGNEDVEWLASGMTETLISGLTQIPNLAVKASSTVFYYKDKNASPKQLGEELGVEAVLLGKIAQRNDDLVIRLELVDTRTLDAIWSSTYNRKVSDLVSVQTDIARDVARNVSSRLSVPESEKVSKTETTDSSAYQAYLKGRFHLDTQTSDGVKRAIDLFDQAIRIDPNYAKAWSGLADAYLLLPRLTDTRSNESLPNGSSAAEKAVALNPDSAEARTSLAVVLQYQWRFAEAEREFKKAISLDPKYAEASLGYSNLLSDLGRHDEAIREITVAHQLEPLSLSINLRLAIVLVRARRSKEAIDQARKTVSTFADAPQAHTLFCVLTVNEERFSEAAAAHDRAIQLDAGFGGCLGKIYAKQGKKQELDKLYMDRPSRNDFDGFVEAGRYSLLNDRAKALEIMERLYAERSPYLTQIGSMEDFYNLRGDPRYENLLKRIGLTVPNE